LADESTGTCKSLRETINNPALWTCFRDGRREARDDMPGMNMGMPGARKHALRVAGKRPGKNNREK
jgi:hypothetical protein